MANTKVSAAKIKQTPSRSAAASLDAVSLGLKWRMRSITILVLSMVVLGIIAQWKHDSGWGEVALLLLDACWILGVPFLGWHASVPFAARVLFPLGMLSGLDLNGAFVRDHLWTVGDLPLIFFFAGWLVDWCLSGMRKQANLAGRAMVTVLYIWFAFKALGGSPLKVTLALILIGVGAVILWLPREFLLPKSQRFECDALLSPLRKGASWIMARLALALFVFLPALLYLDLVDLPENLSSAEYTEGAKPLYWLREGRPITNTDLQEREIYLSELIDEERWKKELDSFRRAPTSSAQAEGLRSLGVRWQGSLQEMSQQLDNPLLTWFYVEPNATDDERASAGILWSGIIFEKLKASQELRLVSPESVQNTSAHLHMAIWVVLVNSIIILLVLTSPAGSSAAAWWLVILLAGANIGWTQESLPYVVERIYYVVWTRFGNDPVGGFLTAIYAVLTGLGYIAAWVNKMGIAIAGLWVALCWPHRPQRLVCSSADRFWVQLPKLVLIVTGLWVLRILSSQAGNWLGTPGTPWLLYWLFLEPVVLFGVGFLVRRRSILSRRVPLLGVLAACALLLRQITGLLWVVESNFMPYIGGWLGWLAVGLYVVFGLMMVIALERGKFLAPPHLQGQLWLVGVAAIPFVANIVGDPVAMAIDSSGLFLGNSAGWLAFAAAVWCLDPVFSWISDRLSSFRVKGLDQISDSKEKLLECCHGDVPPARVRREVRKVIKAIGLKQCLGWRRCGQTLCRIYMQEKRSLPAVCVMMPDILAAQLAECEGALRLEETKLEWKWAAFEPALDQIEQLLGDVLILPVSHDGVLLGVLTVPDLPENRVLLRPVVGQQLASLLAVAHFLLPAQPAEG